MAKVYSKLEVPTKGPCTLVVALSLDSKLTTVRARYPHWAPTNITQSETTCDYIIAYLCSYNLNPITSVKGPKSLSKDPLEINDPQIHGGQFLTRPPLPC